MNSKKIVLFTALVTLLIVALIILADIIYGYCPRTYIDATGTQYCGKSVSDFVPEILMLIGFFVSLPIFFLSLLTYRMKEEVFHAWWNFARWWVPIMVIAVLLALDRSDSFLPPLFSKVNVGLLFGGVFIVVSLAKIVRAYARTKWRK